MIAPLLLVLAGCSNITFDAMNYDRVLTLHEITASLKEQCDNPKIIRDQIPVIVSKANHLALYSKLRTGGPEVASSTETVASMVTEFASHYKDADPSLGYCKTKLDAISVASYAIASTLGAQQ